MVPVEDCAYRSLCPGYLSGACLNAFQKASFRHATGFEAKRVGATSPYSRRDQSKITPIAVDRSVWSIL